VALPVTESQRITLVDVEEFCIELEFTADYAIVHMQRVTGFNRQALRKMRAYADALQGFLTLHYSAVYTAAAHDRTDLHKLAPHLGYREVGRDATYIIYARG